jgi:hypothetical protein
MTAGGCGTGSRAARISLATRSFLLAAERADSTTHRMHSSRCMAFVSQASPACRFLLDLVSAILILLAARAPWPRAATIPRFHINYPNGTKAICTSNDPSRTRIGLI